MYFRPNLKTWLRACVIQSQLLRDNRFGWWHVSGQGYCILVEYSSVKNWGLLCLF